MPTNRDVILSNEGPIVILSDEGPIVILSEFA
jgi:hypothetical protein